MTNPNQRAVFNAAYRIGAALGRKFEASDLTVELRQAAHLYASVYEGDFLYMLNLRDQVNGGVMLFSDMQSKSILNCLMTDAKRRLADKPKAKRRLRIDLETGVEESAEELLTLVASTRPDTCRTLTEARAEGRPRTYAELFEEN
jgi:hypothetical protein